MTVIVTIEGHDVAVAAGKALATDDTADEVVLWNVVRTAVDELTSEVVVEEAII